MKKRIAELEAAQIPEVPKEKGITSDAGNEFSAVRTLSYFPLAQQSMLSALAAERGSSVIVILAIPVQLRFSTKPKKEITIDR